MTIQRIMLKSKIHRATLTATELNYEGSIAIDSQLLREADLLPGEQVHVLNLNNGKRLITYVIEAPAGSGTVMLNGPAARAGSVGDQVIILAFVVVSEDKARIMRARTVYVDTQNRPCPSPPKD